MAAFDQERWNRIQSLFEAASALSGDERRSFLTAECVGDAPLREEVESLLDAADRGGGVIEDAIRRLLG